MRFSNLVDYKGVPHYVVKTGRKNIRILKPGEAYEKSFVVPLKRVSNRRPRSTWRSPRTIWTTTWSSTRAAETPWSTCGFPNWRTNSSSRSRRQQRG